MKHRKTNLICCKCENPIYTDEGFYPGKKPHHARTCKCIMNARECKTYEQPKDFKKTFHLISVERKEKRKAGFNFDEN